MGSFTELVLAFTFSKETPEEILGAFVEWRVADEAPDLPRLEDSWGPDAFDADMHLGNYFGDDPMGGLSLLHQAAVWRYLLNWGENAYFAGTPATALRWHRDRWTLTTRTLPKESPDWVRAMVLPLGVWASEGVGGQPRFVGYLKDEATMRPVLIWSTGERPFQFEGDFDY